MPAPTKAKAAPADSSPESSQPSTGAVAATAAPAPEAQTTPDPNEIVTIYNRAPSTGANVHDVYENIVDADGVLRGQRVADTYRAQGQSFTKVPRWLADLWKKQNPELIVDPSDIGAPKNTSPGEFNRISQENADLKSRLSALESKLSDLAKS